MLEYLFTPIPGSRFRFYIVFIVIAALLFVGSFFFSFLLKKHKKDDKALKKLFERIPSSMRLFAIILGLLLFVRYSRVPYISTRIVFFLFLAWVLYKITRAAYIYVKIYPLEKVRYGISSTGKIYSTRKHKHR